MANGKKGENFGRKPGKRLLWRISFEGSGVVVVTLAFTSVRAFRKGAAKANNENE
jgi:hypothetical protein